MNEHDQHSSSSPPAKSDDESSNSSVENEQSVVAEPKEAPGKEPTEKDPREEASGNSTEARDENSPAEVVSPEKDRLTSPLSFLRGGHPLRIFRGLSMFGVGALGMFLLMARDAQWRFSVPVGFVFLCIAAFGALDTFGTFDDTVPWRVGVPKKGVRGVATLPPAHVHDDVVRLSAATGWLAITLVLLLTTMTAMAHARGMGWGVALAFGWAATCAAGFKAMAKLKLVDEVTRPLFSRHGFWLILFCCALYLPSLGAHGLIDPWETHYGEVAREVLARDDWITIWWAEEGYFLSKPILDFWIQALAMATFGVAFRPGDMIAPTSPGGAPVQPEWIVRLPSLALSVVALYLAYRAVSQIRGRRAGLLGALVLATMGDWMMLSHQSITDMPFVAAITASMSLLILGLTTDDNKTVKATPIRVMGRTYAVSGFHLALGIVLLCALPQAIYLLSRNFELVTQNGFGFAPHGDEFHPGSGGMCWAPPGAGDSFDRLIRIGKWPCPIEKPRVPAFQPALQGLLWLGCISVLLFWNRNERRISRLFFLVAWVFASISTMGKGVAGFLLPIAVAGMYVITANKWRDLLRLELFSGLLILATVAAPWFVAMYMRLGDEFINQLFVHHMWKRALDHVHDTNTGDDVSIRYYIWQLGYGFFPWTGLVPAGLIWWARTRWGNAKHILTPSQERFRDVSTFLVMWFVFAWALFTYMKTKFHHYVFPAVPPAALLLGMYLDEALGPEPFAKNGRRLAYGLVTVLGSALTIFGFSRLAIGPFFGRIPIDKPLKEITALQGYQTATTLYPASTGMALFLGFAGVALAIVGMRAGRDDDAKAPIIAEEEDETARNLASAEVSPEGDIYRRADDPAEGTAGPDYRGMLWAAVALAGAVTTALVTRDLASRPDSDIKGQERLIHLFTYRYDRIWPKDVVFSPALLGFGLATVVFMVVLVSRTFRRQAIASLVVIATLFSAWTLNVYMPTIAPHWGQRTTFEAYYRDRQSEREPLVAFEMNWKGENFYAGGRLVEFGNGMSQGATAGERGSDRMRTWLADMKRTDVKAIYFLTEEGRSHKVEEMMNSTFGPKPGAAKWLEAITTEETSNKFMMFRAKIGR